MRKAVVWGDKPDRTLIASGVHLILWMLLVVIISQKVLLPALKEGTAFGIAITRTETVIIDFASHVNFVKEAWTGKPTGSPADSVYSVAHHLVATGKWAGTSSSYALPFGYSPTMIWLLAPLVFFPHATAFCIFNVAGLLSVWWQTRPNRCRLGFGLVPFFSPLFSACMLLGQTALVTGASLLFLAESTQNREHDGNARRALYAGTALWVLTAKPPLALTAGAVLVALKKWQPLMIALGLTLATTAFITPLLGAGWIRDYLHMIARYDLVQADRAYAWSLVPAHMANLRSILNVDFGMPDNVASRISTVLWLCSLAGMTLFAARLKLQQAGCWALALLSYLLFCPHVSSTEELQLVLLVPLCIPVVKRLNPYESALFAFLLLLPFLSPAFGPFFVGCRWGLFAAKIVLVFAVIYYCRESREHNGTGYGLSCPDSGGSQVC